MRWLLLISLLILVIITSKEFFKASGQIKRFIYGTFIICLLAIAVTIVRSGAKVRIELPNGGGISIETVAKINPFTGETLTSLGIVNTGTENKMARFKLISDKAIKSVRFEMNEKVKIDKIPEKNAYVVEMMLSPGEVISGTSSSTTAVTFIPLEDWNK